MKKIILVRHAKSSWEYNVSDMDRPLKRRGINDAMLVSNEFELSNLEVDYVFSSPANRALSTCKIFLEKLNIPLERLKISNDLYDFGGSSVINFIKLIDDSHKNVMIFGHNHAFTAITNTYGSTYVDNLPTSGLVIIEFNIDNWANLEQGKTLLTLFPAQLKD